MKLILLISLFLFSFSVFSKPKVIYGADNRVDAMNSYDNAQRYLARSTVAMIPANAISRHNANSLYGVIKGVSLRDRLGIDPMTGQKVTQLCKDERFGMQPTAANCSGFMISDDMIATAGHCMQSMEMCRDNYWVFDYFAKGEFDTEVIVPASSVYRCARVIKQAFDGETLNDYAIIQLDRKVTDRPPLKLRASGSIMYQENVFVIGYPTGLPGKVADTAWVTNNYGGKGKYFATNLDTFGGNSGSAVFNARTYEVEGILVRGDTDYFFDQSAQCIRPYQCNLFPNDKCNMGEHVTRITEIYK
ncbi:MAG: trypsin-like peptidase domain-containing protein [Bacteriovoracaceae bacterium]|nr:trypsin-like peptidase domain-containing protein [Bacteriovoracaceae bacterium]